MSLELCVLGSGSSGNCSALRTPNGLVLIDAGLGPSTVAARLRGTGATLADVRAICLTHLDRDHFNINWLPTLLARNIRLFVHSQRLNDLWDIAAEHELLADRSDDFERCLTTFGTTRSFDLIEHVAARAIKLAHDRTGSHAFVIEGFGIRIGYATDLGHVPNDLIEYFKGADVIALESNYDPAMQEASPRPYFLKRRITGGAGHLSNAQAFEAVRAILDRSQREIGRMPSHIVLLHRSRQCNCPKLVSELFAQDSRVAERLTLSHQHAATPWLRTPEIRPACGEQLMLGWS